MWRAITSDLALRQLRKLPKNVQEAVNRRIEWLRQNADAIRHERLTGTEEFTLHVGQYLFLYLLDCDRHLITITDMGKHDEVYPRLRHR